METEIKLRDYQQECVDIINNAEAGNHLVVLPTGSGKTVIFSHINRPGRMLILSHREELVHQPEKYFDCSYGVERAEETSSGEDVISASVQSMVRRLDKFEEDDFDIIITDEAHHAVAPTYQKIYEHFSPRLHIGFTATPNRFDKQGLSKIYSDIIYHKDMKWAIGKGYLCDIKCLQVDIGYDVSKVKKQMGDLNLESLDEAVNQAKINEGIARAYNKYAVGQTVIFGMNVAHCHNIKKALIKTGHKKDEIAVVTAQTENRAEALEKFANKEIKCIINCMVLTEGTDLPMIETVIMARPTLNESLYTQAVGRGTRNYPGKKFLTLVDCVGISGTLKLCTAPSLFGIDTDVVDEEGKKKLNGVMLTEMEDEVIQLADTPEAWIINAQQVSLFTEDAGIKDSRIAWQLSHDDSLYCSIGKKSDARITKTDELGRCQFVVYENSKLAYASPAMTMASAFDTAYNYLTRYKYDERNLWRKAEVSKWENDSASKKQIDFIHSLMSIKEFNGKYKNKKLPDKLTKGQASIIISKLLRESNNITK